MKQLSVCILFALLSVHLSAQSKYSSSNKQQATMQINLSGVWQVQLDSTNVGEKQQWAKKKLQSSQKVKLPGSLTSNQIGDEVGMNTPWMGERSCVGPNLFLTEEKYVPYRKDGENFKVPFWLQPDKYYKGLAWYQKEITIPRSWKNKTIELNLERSHWKTTVFVDGQSFGSQNSLATPHRYSLSGLSAGKHLLTIVVDNNCQFGIGVNASSITDHSQTNWNGLIGDISLKASGLIWLKDIQLFPDIQMKTVRVVAQLGNKTGKAVSGKLKLQAESYNTSILHQTQPVEIEFTAQNDMIEAVYPMGTQVQLWDEFNPALYRLHVSVNGTGYADEQSISFGMREIKTQGRTILVNNIPRFLRATVDCAAFPKTGYPPMDVSEWQKIFSQCKAYGLNSVRFHSWCPPNAAFVAADMEGIYLHVECGVWLWGDIGSSADSRPWLLDEAKRISQTYGNHPSFILLVHGNEPTDPYHDWIKDVWVPLAKKDTRHLVSASVLYPLTDNSDVLVAGTKVKGFHYRYQGAMNGMPATTRNYENQIITRPQPCIAHESGQWCVFPNLKEIGKYTGCIKARNFEIVRDFMSKNHLLQKAEDFLMASGKFQTLIYKEDNEAFLRTRGSAGYQMLGLNDFPGQGTALVGVLDVFYEEKGYVNAKEFYRFNGPVVPLAIMKKRVWTSNETFSASIRIAQYSGKPITNAKPYWEVSGKNGKIIASGQLMSGEIPVGNDTELGEVSIPLSTFTQAEKLILKVAIANTGWQNEWSFWVYPDTLNQNQNNVNVCNTMDEAEVKLQKGEAVLLLADFKKVTGKTAGSFSPIYWNKAWFPGQKEHTLGWLIQDKHPAFNSFPTDFHSDWQWWDLMRNCKPMVLDLLPPTIQPLCEPIDDWNTCRRLATLFEVRVGNGKLLICSMDLTNKMNERPVARQMYYSLINYINSSAFNPSVQLTNQQVRSLFMP
jgi:hypothetical protein